MSKRYQINLFQYSFHVFHIYIDTIRHRLVLGPGLPGSVMFSSKVDVQRHFKGCDQLPCLCIYICHPELTLLRLQTSCFWIAILVFCLQVFFPLQSFTWILKLISVYACV